jgi:quinol monooxygenase YgiN
VEVNTLAWSRTSRSIHAPAAGAGRYADHLVEALMAIIVAGRIYVNSGQRDRFLAGSRSAMELARRTTGCDDFVVAPDPLDPLRVNVYEIWRTREALIAFRGSGPDDGLALLIARADVREYEA